MDEDRGRPRVLARARRAHQRATTQLLDRRGVLPGDPHPRHVGRGRPALPQGEGRRRRRLPHHAALLRQRALLRLRRPRPRDRHRGPDRPGHPADHDLQPALARDEHVRRDDPRPRAHRPAPAQGERRGGGRVRRRLRDDAVRRPAGPRRARASTSTRSTAPRRRARSSARCASGARGTASAPRSASPPPGDARLAQLDVSFSASAGEPSGRW